IAIVLAAALTGIALTVWWLHEPIAIKLPPRPPTERESPEQAVAALVKLGARIDVDDKRSDKPVVAVRFEGNQGGDGDMVHLEPLTQLELLVPPVGITDAGLTHLKDLKQLRDIDLQTKSVGDAGMAHLRDLTELRTLALDGTQVGDAGLAHLQGLTQL